MSIRTAHRGKTGPDCTTKMDLSRPKSTTLTKQSLGSGSREEWAEQPGKDKHRSNTVPKDDQLLLKSGDGIRRCRTDM